MRDSLSEYGGDACYAATGSRQIPRITKPVDVPGLPSRTGVQPSSPPKNTSVKNAKALTLQKPSAS